MVDTSHISNTVNNVYSNYLKDNAEKIVNDISSSIKSQYGGLNRIPTEQLVSELSAILLMKSTLINREILTLTLQELLKDFV